MTIAIYARSTKDNPTRYLEEMHAYLSQEGVDMIIYAPYYQYLKEHFGFQVECATYATSEELIAKAFYLICLGGDGTMLETVTFVRKSGIPVLGVNTGRLGFLSSVNKDDLRNALSLLLLEKFTLDKRELIEIEGFPDSFNGVNYALNEFTIHKNDSSTMIHIDAHVDGQFLNSYFADLWLTLFNTRHTMMVF